jgi:hypothetical protein
MREERNTVLPVSRNLREERNTVLPVSRNLREENTRMLWSAVEFVRHALTGFPFVHIVHYRYITCYLFAAKLKKKFHMMQKNLLLSDR